MADGTELLRSPVLGKMRGDGICSIWSQWSWRGAATLFQLSQEEIELRIDGEVAREGTQRDCFYILIETVSSPPLSLSTSIY